MRVVLWIATMLFLVAFFSYGYVLWSRSKARRDARVQEGDTRVHERDAGVQQRDASVQERDPGVEEPDRSARE